MKKIKKIDLLVMIANRNAPERFINDDCLWYKGKSDKEHYYGDGGKCQLNYIKIDELNDEIELFDEEDEYEVFEEEIKTPTLDNMKDIGYKVGKAYREFFEGVIAGWEKYDKK